MVKSYKIVLIRRNQIAKLANLNKNRMFAMFFKPQTFYKEYYMYWKKTLTVYTNCTWQFVLWFCLLFMYTCTPFHFYTTLYLLHVHVYVKMKLFITNFDSTNGNNTTRRFCSITIPCKILASEQTLAAPCLNSFLTVFFSTLSFLL